MMESVTQQHRLVQARPVPSPSDVCLLDPVDHYQHGEESATNPFDHHHDLAFSASPHGKTRQGAAVPAGQRTGRQSRDECW